MHEVSTVSTMVNALLEELKKYNVVSVEAVTMVIGRMTNLGKEQMEFAYEIVTRDTILEGSKLIIEEEEIIVKCDGCRYEGPVGVVDMGDEYTHAVPILACPKCKGPVTLTAGQACCIKNIDIVEGN